MNTFVQKTFIQTKKHEFKKSSIIFSLASTSQDNTKEEENSLVERTVSW